MSSSTLSALEQGGCFHDTLDLVGKTPLVRLSRLSPKSGAVVWGKCEFMNPGGSVKDRPALAMIKEAKANGQLKKGAAIVEATRPLCRLRGGPEAPWWERL